jgi:predicted nucleotidyltransferase
MSDGLRIATQDADALRDFARKVRVLLGPQLVEIRLYGSKARGEDAPDSDIDVAVVVRGTSTEVEDQVLDIAFEVNLAYGVYISPRVIPHAVLDDPVWKLTPFLQAIQKDGVPL